MLSLFVGIGLVQFIAGLHVTSQRLCWWSSGRNPFNQNFRPVWPGKMVHLKRWSSFFETFPVGPNQSIEFWTEIFGNFGWMDCVRAKLPEERNALFSCEFFVKKNYDVLSPNMAALSRGCPKYLFPELRCLLHCYLCIFSRVSHPNSTCRFRGSHCM